MENTHKKEVRAKKRQRGLRQDRNRSCAPAIVHDLKRNPI